MNKNKIDKALNIKSNSVTIEPIVEEGLIQTEDNSEEVIPYTENPELLKDIDRYKKEREENIDVLKDARKNIKVINKHLIETMESDEIGPSAKEVDSYAKIINTLVNLTREIDEQTGPNKIELYIDSVRKKDDQEPRTINNTQINIASTPAEILKMIEDKVKKA